jgi:hypothetical protein
MSPVEVVAAGLSESSRRVRIVGEGADAKDFCEVDDDQPTSPSDRGRLNLRARLEDAVKVMAQRFQLMSKQKTWLSLIIQPKLYVLLEKITNNRGKLERVARRQEQ